jgi:hypothetical protein
VTQQSKQELLLMSYQTVLTDRYNNYQNRFIQLANLRIDNLPKKINIDDEEFVIKSEFHITVLAVEQIAQLINADFTEDLKLEIVDYFYNFVKSTPLTNYRLTNELRMVQDGSSKTIIVMAELDDIDMLFLELRNKYSVELPVQPTHITLYTLPSDTFGIPIFSYEELFEISKIINLPELDLS